MPGITLVLLYWDAGIIGSCLTCCATALGPCNRNCNLSFNLTVLLFSYIPCLSSNLYSVTRETSSHFLLYTLALVLCNYKRLMDIMDFDYFFFSFWSLFSFFFERQRKRDVISTGLFLWIPTTTRSSEAKARSLEYNSCAVWVAGTKVFKSLPAASQEAD